MRPKRGRAVWSTDSGVTWEQGVFPTQDDLIGPEGTYWFLGGHIYTISDDIAAGLINAGFESYITPELFPESGLYPSTTLYLETG